MTIRQIIYFIIVLYLLSMGLIRIFFPDSTESTLPPELESVYQAELLQIEKHIMFGELDIAMPLISALLTKTSDLDKAHKAWLYNKQAYIYQHRGHHHYAIESFKNSNRFSNDHHLHDNDIAQLQILIDQTQTERDYRTTYRNNRHSGISKDFQHDVTIAYIYIDDNQWSKWSTKERQKNNFNLDQVINWYQQQANVYNIHDLNIDVRYFAIKSPKGISKEWLRDPTFFPYTQSLISRQLGYESFNSFTDDITHHDTNHQVALVFHTNNQDRSFAKPCPNTIYKVACNYEYVMLTEQMSHYRNLARVQFVQSHEILHLFGADDLYNIKAAKDYAVTDIMNYQSQALIYSTIEPITAWAIGWADLPKTPFKVLYPKD